MTVWDARLARDSRRYLCGWSVNGRTPCDQVLAEFRQLVDADELIEFPWSIDVASFYVVARTKDGYQCTIPEYVRAKLERGQFPRGRRGIPPAAIRQYGFEVGLAPPVTVQCARDRLHGSSIIRDFPPVT